MFGHPLVFFDSFQFDSNKKWCFFYVQFIQKQKSNYFITGKKNKKKSMIYIRQEKTTLYVVKRLFYRCCKLLSDVRYLRGRLFLFIENWKFNTLKYSTDKCSLFLFRRINSSYKNGLQVKLRLGRHIPIIYLSRNLQSFRCQSTVLLVRRIFHFNFCTYII